MGHSISENTFWKRRVKEEARDAVAAEYTKTLGDIKESGFQVLKDIAIGVGLGNIATRICGRPSFLYGLAATGIGHYKGSRVLSTFGLGMMITAISQVTTTSLNGLGAVDTAKVSLTELKDGFSHSLYLDKFLPGSSESVQGIGGDVQYYVYPDSQ